MTQKIKSKLVAPCGSKVYYNPDSRAWYCRKHFITIYDEDLSIHKAEAAKPRPAFWWMGYAVACSSLVSLAAALWVFLH